ncbi:hypothetical protein ZWY2020_005989 [Hordeum vulgare]|nr:hypothetical protein ZWY2020_005989 [Hordeum vulgare]
MMSHSPVPNDDEEEDDGLIAVLEGKTVFLCGASSLPKRGESVEQRPWITPYGVSTCTEVGYEAPGKCRHVNGVIGILLKEHFPGMVTFPGEGNVLEVARTWEHYKACEDVGTFNNIEVHNKAEWVFAEIWDFYRCKDGKLEEAQVNVNIHCKKLVRNIFYYVRIIAVHSYKAFNGYKMATKTPATKIFLTEEEYMQAAHHKAEEPNLFIGYALSHKASFKKATPYDLSKTSSAYTSQTAYNRLTKVREVATKFRGTDYDVASEPLDHELVMIAREGKKHGKEAIAGDMFPRSSTRTLADHKARLGLPKSFVCEHATPARAEMEAYCTQYGMPAFNFLPLLCVLCIHGPMDRIMLDLHMLMLLATTLMVLRMFEICYG